MVVVDGIHDLGGRQGFGPVAVEPDEPPFHQSWEATARAVTIAVVGAVAVTGGEFRHSIERMDPGHYLTSPYYEHWLTGAASLAVEHGLLSEADLESRAQGPFPLSRPVSDTAPAAVKAFGATPGAARFGAGDRVRVRDWRPAGHTRCPWYVRGRTGVVIRVDGSHSVPDVEAHLPDKVHQATYSVRFDGTELWGVEQAGVTVHVDLWDSYLEPVT